MDAKTRSAAAGRWKRAALASFLWLSAPAASQAELVDVSITDPSGRVVVQTAAQQDVPRPTAPPTQPGEDAEPTPQDATQPPVPLQPDGPFTPQPLTPQPLAAPAPPGMPSNLGSRSLAASIGVTAGGMSSAPMMMGDLFGGGISIINLSEPITTQFFAPGSIIAGTGPADWQLGFSFDGGAPTDVFTQVGTGLDASGDGNIDTFSIFEPVPPTNAPTAPGPGFVFAGGTATYTNSDSDPSASDGQFSDGEDWFINYSYVSQGFNVDGQPVIVAGPDVATRRVKIAENFSPEVRDRMFFSFNFFDNAFGGLGDVSRYILGLERVLYEDLISLEARMPMAGTLSSRQQVDRPGDRNFELGNATLIGKAVLLRTRKLTWTGGLGVTLPFADDARVLRGNDELLVIRNHSVHLLPFTGMVYRKNERTFLQAYTQLDVAAKGNPVSANLSGGPLRSIGTFNDSTLMHIDVSAHRIVYLNPRAQMLRGIITNAELHYTGTLQESDRVEGEGVVVTNLQRNFNVVNATFGTHLLMGDHIVVTPGFAVPLRRGLDRQFDIEGILQLNYLF